MDFEPVGFNGIDGSTGECLLAPLSPPDLIRLALSDRPDRGHVREFLANAYRSSQPSFGVLEGFDATRVDEAGWGAVFAHDAPPSIRDALRPLLEHRREQAEKGRSNRYREYVGYEGYRPGEDAHKFLSRHGATAGMAADPDRVPYYLLIVGSPSVLPFRFQYQLDVEYAVGRLWFETPEGRPDLDAFHRYAQSVVAAETGGRPRPRRATVFATRHPSDQATEVSSIQFAAPLADALTGAVPGWEVRKVSGSDARKDRLRDLLDGPDVPALLVTATHGIGFPVGHPFCPAHHGAFLCQDWPGPFEWGARPIPPEFYFSADDVPHAADLSGLVAMCFSTFSAGDPGADDEAARMLGRTSRPTLAQLPQRLLGCPRGGAHAVIGVAGRVWSLSYPWPDRPTVQIATVLTALHRLLRGEPVGLALTGIHELYAELATAVSSEQEDLRYGKVPDYLRLATLWTQLADARNIVVLGDPVVRLPMA